METISVRERDTAELTRDQYRRLEGNRDLWSLVDAGILSLERTKRKNFGLKAGPYVGQAVVGDLLLRVEEKVPGSLRGLLRYAEEPDVRLQDAASFADEEGEFLRPLVDRFLRLLDAYLVRGRIKRYATVQERGPMPRGKLLVQHTMRRWAVGRRDQVVFARDVLTPRLFANQLVALAVQRALSAIGRGEADRARRRRLRTAAILFDDCGWTALAGLPSQAIDQAYDRTRRDWGEHGALGTLARLLAMHFRGSTGTPPRTSVPASWFVNLESLFEDCVRSAIASAAKVVGSATDWRVRRFNVLGGTSHYRAEPDIVLWSGGSPAAILDAKFKELERVPQNADVYQLLAHANAWGVGEAALIYPGDTTAIRIVGSSHTGVQVRTCTVDCRDLSQSARTLVGSYAALFE